MSELNMNDLPCEMLAKVFRSLDVVDLKNAVLTCKLWNNLIESECRWSLQLDYDNSHEIWGTRIAEPKMNFIMTTNRKFGTIEIWNKHLARVDQIHKICRRLGFSVVELTLYKCRVDNLAAFAELLNLIPNLSCVEMQIIDSTRCNTQLGQTLPELKKLKSLRMDIEDQRILQCFRKAKLREICIWEHWLKHLDSLVDFFLTQDSLTSLATSPSVLVELERLNVPFRLTQLSITGLAQHSDNLLRFVESQSQNLVDLTIGSNFLNFFCECIMKGLPKLNILRVATSGKLPDFDNDFYDGLEMNRSVQTVTLSSCRYKDRGSAFLGKFLKKLPNVRSLSFPYSGHLDNIAQTLKLESLAIRWYTDERSFDCVKFPNLKSLQIQGLHAKIDWNEFTKAHPLLTELTIQKMSNDFCLTSEDIDQITTNVDLQCIRLGVGFVADDRFFEIIRTKCKNLKVLDLAVDYNVWFD